MIATNPRKFNALILLHYLTTKNEHWQDSSEIEKKSFILESMNKSSGIQIDEGHYPHKIHSTILDDIWYRLSQTDNFTTLNQLVVGEHNFEDHDFLLVLVKNKTELYNLIERVESMTGGPDSKAIHDHGEFRLIQKNENLEIVKSADFSFYEIQKKVLNEVDISNLWRTLVDLV